MTYTITLRHHSIKPELFKFEGSLTGAKRAATRRFGDGFQDHRIDIYSGPDTLVSSRLVSSKWEDAK